MEKRIYELLDELKHELNIMADAEDIVALAIVINDIEVDLDKLLRLKANQLTQE